MKIVSKLKFEIPLACRGCVAPARGILLGLASCFPLISPKADFFSGFKPSVKHGAHVNHQANAKYDDK